MPSQPRAPEGDVDAMAQSASRLGNAAQKPLLLLLPGLLCDEANWAGQCGGLQSIVDCQVPGYGQLDNIEAMAGHVLAQARAECFALAGHSMGGRVALEIVRQAPQRVQRLALLDTGVAPLAAGEAGDKERAVRQQLLEQARAEGMRMMGAKWARAMVRPQRVATPLFEAILDMIARKTPDIFAAQINALLNRPDARPLLSRIECPTLVLCGRQDLWSPLARHEEMQRAIVDSTLDVIDDCGHMSTMEQPAAVTGALAQWLRA